MKPARVHAIPRRRFCVAWHRIKAFCGGFATAASLAVLGWALVPLAIATAFFAVAFAAFWITRRKR